MKLVVQLTGVPEPPDMFSVFRGSSCRDCLKSSEQDSGSWGDNDNERLWWIRSYKGWKTLKCPTVNDPIWVECFLDTMDTYGDWTTVVVFSTTPFWTLEILSGHPNRSLLLFDDTFPRVETTSLMSPTETSSRDVQWTIENRTQGFIGDEEFGPKT